MRLQEFSLALGSLGIHFMTACGDSSDDNPNVRQPPTANRQPPTANRQPPTANRQPPTANRQPPTAKRNVT
jgi:hypothetical protein